MRSLLLPLAVCMFLVVGVQVGVQAQEVTTFAPVTPAPTEAPDLAGAKTLLERPGLSIRDRRAMGLTVRNVRKVVIELHKSGELADMTQDEVSVVVLERLVDDNPQAFADPGVDWDSILAFIERLIPLIIKLIALFGAV